jgi:hypothetical protein
MSGVNLIAPVLIVVGIGTAAASAPQWHISLGRGGVSAAACRPLVSSGRWAADTPSDAETRALIAWTRLAAGSYGDQFGAWHNAAGRAIECSEIVGGFKCDATGRPCETGHVATASPTEYY